MSKTAVAEDQPGVWTYYGEGSKGWEIWTMVTTTGRRYWKQLKSTS